MSSVTQVDDVAAQREAARPDDDGIIRAADGTPLKQRLARALRREKLRSFTLIAPLLLFIVLSFLAPIADMLFRSVQNDITPDTLPRTVVAMESWDPGEGEMPSLRTYEALYYDMFLAAEARRHTRLGSRLNYESAGMSSLFRGTGRDLDDFREADVEAIENADPGFEEAAFWFGLMSGEGGERLMEERRRALMRLADLESRGVIGDAWCTVKGVFGAACETAPEDVPLGFTLSGEVRDLLPRTAIAYSDWAALTVLEDEDVVAEEEPYEAVFVALADDLRQRTADELDALGPDYAPALVAAKQAVDLSTPATFRDLFLESDEEWGSVENWRVMKRFSGQLTPGYYLSAIDADSTAEGFELKPEDERIYLTLFVRTMWMSMLITFSCLLLGYPIAYLMSHSKRSTANLLMILVLLPFWTSLLVRTSAWKVLLQQQGVINDLLVWLNLIDDAGRLVMINNQLGTIIAMTHILLPFMILPLYSVMQTVSPSFVRAAKSMGANDWTAFWRIYFPNTVPGIGAGAILVFILSIGYYITPELVGGTQGVFISNRIAYHIQFSLNWGLAAALGAILLLLVILLFYVYDRIVGIDNVKLG